MTMQCLFKSMFSIQDHAASAGCMAMMCWATLSCRDAQGPYSVYSYSGVFCHSSDSQNTLQKLGSFLLFLNIYTFPLALNGRLHGSDAMDCNATQKRKSQVNSS